MKVSVIVPVYNAEDYLRECLDSLMAQTMSPSEIEILAIDDCSEDDSLQILEEYQSRYPQLRVLRTSKNSGAGGARNVGLDAARGEYLGFVDSDDAVVPTMYEHLYDVAIAGDYDMVDSGIYDRKNDLAMVHTADEDTGDQTDEKRSHNIVSGGYLVSRITRRTFWEDCGVRFRTRMILEDMETLMLLLARAERIGNLKELCYVYRDTIDSASKKVEYESYQRQTQAAMEAVYGRMASLPCYPGICLAVEYAILQLYSYALTNCLMQKGHIENGKLLERQRKLRALKDAYIKHGYNNPYVQNKMGPEEIRIMEMNDLDPERLLQIVAIKK